MNTVSKQGDCVTAKCCLYRNHTAHCIIIREISLFKANYVRQYIESQKGHADAGVSTFSGLLYTKQGNRLVKHGARLHSARAKARRIFCYHTEFRGVSLPVAGCS